MNCHLKPPFSERWVIGSPPRTVLRWQFSLPYVREDRFKLCNVFGSLGLGTWYILPTWMVDFYGECIDKYIYIHMDPKGYPCGHFGWKGFRISSCLMLRTSREPLRNHLVVFSFIGRVDVPNTRFVSAFRDVKNPHQKHIL